MAQFAIAAQDLPTGYSKGDIISVIPNDALPGILDTLPNIWWVTVPDIPWVLARAHMIPLYEAAMPGDPEFDAVDPQDRRIMRHRRPIRLMWDEVPAGWITTLETTGAIELTVAQVRPFVRLLRWNRGQNGVEKTNNEAF